jgi:hypothetical protein
VPEYDAFGREIGEDTLKGWRQGSGALPADPVPAPPPRPEPAPVSVTAGDPLGGPAPAPAAPPQQPPAQGGRQRVVFAPGTRPRKRRRGMARLIVLLVFGWITFNVISGIAGKVDDVARTIKVPSPNLTLPRAADPPAGLEPRSLLRPAAFQRAIAQIRRRGGGKLQHLRVAPERILATLITSRGTLVTVEVSATDGYRRFSESGSGFSDSDTVPFAKLDARVPQKLTRAAADRLGSPVGAINYLVPSLSDGKVVWGAYFKTGAIFLADARGRITSRIS